jgi:hypothetical protein
MWLEWEGPQIHAFSMLKDLVSSPPCLLMPDLDKPFVVHVDASGYALGAVLQQDQGHGLQPVAFESRENWHLMIGNFLPLYMLCSNVNICS